MKLPEPEQFPSRPTPAGGRIYDVDGPYQMVAYLIEDGETFRDVGAGGLILYTFLHRRHRKVGYWNWTVDPDDLVRVMCAFRDAGRDDRPPPDYRAPSGERATIQPIFRRTFERAVEETTPTLRLDVDAIMRGEQPHEVVRKLSVLRDEEVQPL